MVKKSHLGVFLFAVLLALSMATLPAQAQAQAQGTPLKIKRIQGDAVQAPEYSVKQVRKRSSQNRRWYQIRVIYATVPEWMDQADFTYYALIKGSKPGQRKYTLLKGDVSYVNIEKGNTHESVMFMHPSTVKRLGKVDRVAVIVRASGRVVALESDPKSNERWWDQFSPLDGYLLNRMQTPFAFVDTDFYEAIKPSTGR